MIGDDKAGRSSEGKKTSIHTGNKGNSDTDNHNPDIKDAEGNVLSVTEDLPQQYSTVTGNNKNIIRKIRASYKITNMVISAHLGCTIDVKRISDSYGDAESKPGRFPAVKLMMSRPKSVIFVFPNGKMVITGLKNGNEIKKVIEKIKDKFTKIGINLPARVEYKIVNIVVSGKLNMAVDLFQGAVYLKESIYDPEIFPALIYRPRHINGVFMIFGNGKFVISGLKSEEEIIPSIKHMGNTLRESGVLRFTDI